MVSRFSLGQLSQLQYFRALLAFSAFPVLVSAAFADSPRTTASHSGDYVSLLAIGTVGNFEDASANTGKPDFRNDTDPTGGPGIAIGYNWAKKGLPIRSELEFHYRVRFDLDMRIPHQAGYEVNLESSVLLVNAYYDFSLTPKVTLYAGGGVGWARHMADVERVALVGGTTTTRDDTTDVFTWNLAVGAVWQIGRNWDLDFRYRYIDLGSVDIGPHSDGTTIEAKGYTSHDMIIAAVYRF